MYLCGRGTTLRTSFDGNQTGLAGERISGVRSLVGADVALLAAFRRLETTRVANFVRTDSIVDKLFEFLIVNSLN